jgi:glucose/mannose-6-phosphate isomerase
MTIITHEYAADHFYHQINWAIGQYKNHGLTISQFSNVIIGGLGGSGIGGRITRSALFSNISIPVEVYSEYLLPAYANENTLVILSSYSGNTEETLSLYADAKKRGCKILCITSGGRLKDECNQSNIPTYPIETGYQPRMALGYSLSTLLLIFGELTGIDFKSSLASVAELVQNNTGMKTEAKAIVEKWSHNPNRKVVVVCDYPYEAVAIRFCQQLQENAKLEAFVTVLPEANHNVIETYYGRQDTHFFLLNSGMNQRVNMRFDFLKSLLKQIGAETTEINNEGFDLKTLFRAIHITDWVSIYMSNTRGANNMEVGNIVKLKTFLDELNVQIS